MTYWDNNQKLGVSVKDGKIQYFVYKKPFNSECADVDYGDRKHYYGQVGTAYHSGHSGRHIVNYCGQEAIIVPPNDNGISIASNYSICEDSWIDVDEFIHKNMMSFYTNDTHIMPLIGYAVVHGKLKEPTHSLYEVKNVIKEGTGKKIVCDDNLNGDNLGQMAMFLASGHRVLNNICKTPIRNFFYGKVLSSTLRLPNCVTALIRKKDIKPVKPCCYDIASKWRIRGQYLGLEEFKDVHVHLIRDDEIAIINTVGYLSQFTNGKCDVIYSCTPFGGYDYEAGWNVINERVQDVSN